jgi:cell division septal protein FtsQ
LGKKRVKRKIWRKKKKFFSRKIWLEIKIIIFVSLFFLIFKQINELLHHSPRLQLKKINLIGVITLPYDEIVNQAGLKLDIPLVQINPQLVKENLLAHPQIKSVVVRKFYPQTINIKIEERKPFLLISLNSKVTWGLDREKVIFPLKPPWPDKPLLRGLKSKKFRLGKENQIKEIEAIVKIYRQIKKIKPSFWDRIALIEIKEWPTLIFQLKDTPTVIKLTPEVPVEKWEVFLKNYSFFQNQAEKVAYIDLRFGEDVIIVKPE